MSSDSLLTFMTVDSDIQLGMWTCGHDTSHQFGERLVVHVENQSANRWKDCVQCCGSHSGRHVAEHCTGQNFLCELISLLVPQVRNSDRMVNVPVIFRSQAPIIATAWKQLKIHRHFPVSKDNSSAYVLEKIAYSTQKGWPLWTLGFSIFRQSS